MKVGSTILTPKQYDIIYNGIMLHLQRRRARTIPLAEEMMGTVLWNAEDCILVDSLPRKETVTAVH
jgi:hypothetical protein